MDILQIISKGLLFKQNFIYQKKLFIMIRTLTNLFIHESFLYE